MDIKQLMGVVALALSASLAQAAVYTVDADSSTSGDQPMQAGSHYDSVKTVSVGPVDDTIHFTLASDLLTAWTVTNVFTEVPDIVTNLVTIPGSVNTNISNLQADLFRDEAVDTLLSDNVLTGALPLTSGNYYLKVAGTADGVMGGAYVFSLDTFPNSALPEPASLALTLMGLGLMAYSLRRK